MIYNDQGQLLVCEPSRPHVHHSLHHAHVVVLRPTLRHHHHHARVCHAHVHCHWVDQLGGPAGAEGYDTGGLEQMSAISITWSGGEITGLDATGPFNVNYYLPTGPLFVTLEFDAGAYQAIDLGSAVTTEILTSTLQPIATSAEFLAFTPAAPVMNALATPETSTWLMLMLGFGLLAFKALDKRALVRRR